MKVWRTKPGRLVEAFAINDKQLLNEVFVISRIIKVEVGVITCTVTQYKNKSKTIKWMNSRNWDAIGHW